MAEAVGPAIGARGGEDSIANAVRDAIITGLIAFLLFVVILGLKTENAGDRLILVQRFGLAVTISVVVAVGRLFLDLFVWRARARVAAEPFFTARRLLWLLGLGWLIGAYFFIMPDARENLATAISDVFGSDQWRARTRIAVDLIGFALMGVFVVATAMMIMVLLRRALARAGIGTASESPRLLTQFAEQLGPALLLIALALPFLAVGPQQRYAIDTAIQVLTYIMLGWGLNVVVGLAGLLDLGYVAFYAVGAYSFALLGTTFGWSFWICLPLAGLAAATWGVILGFPVLRLRGDYLAIVTLAFGEIIRIVLLNWQSLTNGPNGISRIPRISFFGLSFDRSAEPSFYSVFGLEYDGIYRVVFMYYVILFLALFVNSSPSGCAACRSAAPGKRCARTRSPAGHSASTLPSPSSPLSPPAPCSAALPARSSPPARVSSARRASPSMNPRWCSPSSCWAGSAASSASSSRRSR